MLQDSFIDALMNKNCIFRNIASPMVAPDSLWNRHNVFFMADVNTLAIKNVMTGLKELGASFIVSRK